MILYCRLPKRRGSANELACWVSMPAELRRRRNFPSLKHFSDWLHRGYAGEMKYLADPRRLDPRNSMPGVRSLIVCALNYNSDLPYSTEVENHENGAARGWISRYAWARITMKFCGES